MLTILISFLLVNNNQAQAIESKSIDFEIREEVYFKFIELIKEHEGLRNKSYSCPSGYLTIGYGHLIKENESFDSISNKQAEELLINDFNKAIDLVKKHTDLKGNKLIAISHFVFAKGIGNFLNSTLYQLIKQGKSIDNEIIKWSYYTSNNHKIYSEKMKENRLFELKYYNK